MEISVAGGAREQPTLGAVEVRRGRQLHPAQPLLVKTAEKGLGWMSCNHHRAAGQMCLGTIQSKLISSSERAPHRADGMEIRNVLQPDFSKAADALIHEPHMLPGAVARQSIVQTHSLERSQAAAVKEASSESPSATPTLLLVPSTPQCPQSPITVWSHGLALTPEFPSAHTTIPLLCESPVVLLL